MDLLAVTPEEKKKIRDYFNLNEDEIKRDVTIIKEWKEKQPHLPYDMTDDFIEKILMRNKFRVERTKQKLDNYYSLRGHLKDLFQNMENTIPSRETTFCLPIPKLTPNLTRVVIIKIAETDPNRYNTPDFIKHHLAIQELCLQYDYSIGTRFIYDMELCTLKHTLKWDVSAFAQLATLVERTYSCRIFGYEFINCSTFVNKIMAMLRVILRAKIYERVTIHKDITSLHSVVPKECLPKEYGGTLDSSPDLLKKWDEVITNHKDFFVKNYENILLGTSLEELRPLDLKTKDQGVFGVDGTFKKLQID